MNQLNAVVLWGFRWILHKAGKIAYVSQLFDLSLNIHDGHVFSVIAKSDSSSKVTLSLGTPTDTSVARGGDISLPDVNAFTAYKCMASFNSGTLTVESAYFDINQLRKSMIFSK